MACREREGGRPATPRLDVRVSSRGASRPRSLVALALSPIVIACTGGTSPAASVDASAARDAADGRVVADATRHDSNVDDARDARDADAADAAVLADAGPPSPPCTEVESDASLGFDPPVPWRGGSVRVRATAITGYTNIGVRLVGPSAPEPRWIGVDGSGPYTWSWSVGPIDAGTYCVELFADPDARVLQRRALRVEAEAPAIAPFKVTRNHQWTCEEEYTWAINVDVHVEDEAGNPMPGTRIAMSHPPCDLRGEPEPPAELVTDERGDVRWENYYPRCFFHLRVADAPSDTAIEIYTGIWETQPTEGGGECNYCSTFAENVWGHWSYAITFRRSPGATEVCEVPTDHAGQSACAPLMHWEEPSGPCTPLPAP